MWLSGGRLQKCNHAFLMNKMAASREEKEAFISGLSGTDLEEMYLLLMATGLGVAIRHSLLLVSERIRKLHQRNIM